MLSDPFTTTTADHRFKVERGCECGCTLNSSHGFIVSNGSCLSTSSIWTIIAEEDYVIRLTFIVGERDVNDDQFRRLNSQIRVRDGETSSDNLLLNADAYHKLSDVTSSGRVMRVEYTTIGVIESSKEGFVAQYTSFCTYVLFLLRSYCIVFVTYRLLKPGSFV